MRYATAPSRARATRRRPGRSTSAALTLAVLGLAGSVASAQQTVHAYTFLGRGFAAIVAYPADYIPDSGGDDETPPEPPPDQTCPEADRGVDEATAARIAEVGDTSGVEPMEPNVDEDTPAPHGQPIKLDFGMADTSLRSDPGAHSIAAFYYADLGGTQDPWTSVETDGYAAGHVRFQERCARPRGTSAGTGNDVHVISQAIEGPYTYAFNRTGRTSFGGGGFIDRSITVSEMDGRGDVKHGRVTVIADGVDIGGGQVRMDSVVTVIDVESHAADPTPVVRAWTLASGVRVGGQPVDLEPGGPPVHGGGFSVTMATPAMRVLADGTIEVDAGGVLVGGSVANPLGLQSKQSVNVAAAWFTAAGNTIALPPPSERQPQPQPEQQPSQPSVLAPFAPVTQPPVRTVATQAPVDEPPVVAPPLAAPRMQRLGVYREGPQAIGTVSLIVATLLALLGAALVFARARSWRFQAILGAAGLRGIDRIYRTFLRG